MMVCDVNHAAIAFAIFTRSSTANICLRWPASGVGRLHPELLINLINDDTMQRIWPGISGDQDAFDLNAQQCDKVPSFQAHCFLWPVAENSCPMPSILRWRVAALWSRDRAAPQHIERRFKFVSPLTNLQFDLIQTKRWIIWHYLCCDMVLNN